VLTRLSVLRVVDSDSVPVEVLTRLPSPEVLTRTPLLPGYRPVLRGIDPEHSRRSAEPTRPRSRRDRHAPDSAVAVRPHSLRPVYIIPVSRKTAVSVNSADINRPACVHTRRSRKTA